MKHMHDLIVLRELESEIAQLGLQIDEMCHAIAGIEYVEDESVSAAMLDPVGYMGDILAVESFDDLRDSFKKTVDKIWKAIVQGIKDLIKLITKYWNAFLSLFTNDKKSQVKKDFDEMLDAARKAQHEAVDEMTKKARALDSAKTLDDILDIESSFYQEFEESIRNSKPKVEKTYAEVMVRFSHDYAESYKPSEFAKPFGNRNDYQRVADELKAFLDDISTAPTSQREAVRIALSFADLNTLSPLADIKDELIQRVTQYDAVTTGKIPQPLVMGDVRYILDIKRSGGKHTVEYSGLRSLKNKPKPASKIELLERKDSVRLQNLFGNEIKRIEKLVEDLSKTSDPITGDKKRFSDAIAALTTYIDQAEEANDKKLTHDLRTIRFLLRTNARALSDDLRVLLSMSKSAGNMINSIYKHPARKDMF